MTVTIRDSTREDVLSLYPDGIPMTIRSWTAIVDGAVAGIGGVILKKGVYTVFMKMNSGYYRKSDVLKTSLLMMEKITSRYQNLYAIRDTSFHNSKRFLERMGFVFVRNEEGMEVWKWQTQ